MTPLSRLCSPLPPARQQEPQLPEGITVLGLLQMVYRGEIKLTLQQMRAAIE
jgi:hypothetical protein